MTTEQPQPTTALARPVASSVATDWQVMKEQASVVAKSQFYSDLGGPEKALTIMLHGQDLGLTPMAAVRGIHIIKGKPTLSAQLMAALVIRAGHPRIKVLQSDNTVCRLTARRKEENEWTEYEFSLEDAKQAGLLESQMWTKYRKNMLYSRAISNICKIVFPDIFMGVYTPEELEGGVDAPEPETKFAVVDITTGERVDVTAPAPAPAVTPTANGGIMTKAQFAQWICTIWEIQLTDKEEMVEALKVVASKLGLENLTKAAETTQHPDPWREMLKLYIEKENLDNEKYPWVWSELENQPTNEIPF